MTASLVDRFVGQLTPAAVQVLVVLGVCVDCGQPDTSLCEACECRRSLAVTVATTTPTSNAPAGELGL
jgi:hypothetical protein